MFQCNPFFPCTIITWQNIAWMLCSHQQLPSLPHHDVASFALVIIEPHEPSPHPSPGKTHQPSTHSVAYNLGKLWLVLMEINSNGFFPGTKKKHKACILTSNCAWILSPLLGSRFVFYFFWTRSMNEWFHLCCWESLSAKGVGVVGVWGWFKVDAVEVS